MKARRFIASILIIFSLVSCSLPTRNATSIPANENAKAISLNQLVSQQVSPAQSDQTVAYKDKVNVTLPGGVVTSAQTLTISTPAGKLPPPSPVRQVVEAYDISLGVQHTFDKDLTIEFSYDPKALSPDQPAAEQLTAGYWDPDHKAWVTVPAKVDETRHVLTISADHLTLWGYFNWVAGYKTDLSTHFMVIYDQKQVQNATGNYTPQATHLRTGVPEFISDVVEFLETAYTAYATAGYTLPEGRINVEVGDIDSSELGSLSGIIRISTLSWSDPNILRQDCAHELFHAVQRATLGLRSYLSRHWWMEATADYAADKVAWATIGGTGQMGADIKPKYLETTLTSTEGFHAYSTAHFVSFLVDHQHASTFKQLWDATVAGGNDMLATLKTFLDKDKPLGLHYTEFARFFVFDPGSPDKKGSSLSGNIAVQTDTLTTDTKEIRQSFPIEYYTAKLWAIQSQVESDVLVERLDSSYGTVSAVAQESDGRQGAGDFSEPVAGKPLSVHLKEGGFLFILMDNTISHSDQTIEMRVTPSLYPTGMFTMNFTFDSGCDSYYKEGYTSWSRVNPFPVKIEGTKATIQYDKTTGSKHLVASGSGSVDSNGVLTLNYTLTYTIDKSCEGKPCQGTETATGTFTGTWQPGAWKGKATGSVAVEYPNTLGKDGNNASSCSANMTKGKLSLGFVDVDL